MSEPARTADLQGHRRRLRRGRRIRRRRLAKLASELLRLKAIEQEMLTAPDQQISLTDSNSRSVGSGMRNDIVDGVR